MGSGDNVTALALIRQVEALGGKLLLDDGCLKLQAAGPLPDVVVAAVTEQKVAIMVALGAPLDTVVGQILAEVRPYLPKSLARLSDDQLLALVNWSIIGAWNTAVRKADQNL